MNAGHALAALHGSPFFIAAIMAFIVCAAVRGRDGTEPVYPLGAVAALAFLSTLPAAGFLPVRVFIAVTGAAVAVVVCRMVDLAVDTIGTAARDRVPLREARRRALAGLAERRECADIVAKHFGALSGFCGAENRAGRSSASAQACRSLVWSVGYDLDERRIGPKEAVALVEAICPQPDTLRSTDLDQAWSASIDLDAVADAVTAAYGGTVNLHGCAGVADAIDRVRDFISTETPAICRARPVDRAS